MLREPRVLMDKSLGKASRSFKRGGGLSGRSGGKSSNGRSFRSGRRSSIPPGCLAPVENEHHRTLLLSIFWFVKVGLLLLLALGALFYLIDLYNVATAQDAQGTNHKVVIILCFLMTIIFQLLLLTMIVLDELCGMVFVAHVRIYILCYVIVNESSYLSVSTFIDDMLSVTLLLVYAVLLCLAK